jgi:hypothetical protein
MGNEGISDVGESTRNRLGTTGTNKVSLALEGLLEDAKYYLTTPEGNKALEATLFPTTGTAKGDLAMMLEDLGLAQGAARTPSAPASSGQVAAHREQVRERSSRTGESSGQAGMGKLQEEYMRRQRLPPDEFLRTLNLVSTAGGGAREMTKEEGATATKAASEKAKTGKVEDQGTPGNYQKFLLWLSEAGKKK